MFTYSPTMGPLYYTVNLSLSFIVAFTRRDFRWRDNRKRFI